MEYQSVPVTYEVIAEDAVINGARTGEQFTLDEDSPILVGPLVESGAIRIVEDN